MSDKKTEGIDALVAFMLLIPVLLLEGLVFSTMWGWFVVPLGIQKIGVIHGIGLATTIHLVTGSPTKLKESAVNYMLVRAINYGMMIAVGAIVHQCM